MLLTDRRVLFFGGKGGVGKTTLAAAHALLLAAEGRRTLLVSTDPAHSTSDLLGVALGSEPTPVELPAGVEAAAPGSPGDPDGSRSPAARRTPDAGAPGRGPLLHALEIDPREEADRYIDGVKERALSVAPPRMHEEVERQIDVARVSPGAEEAALFDRFARILEGAGSDFDRVLFDTAPTGQTLRLLSLPELMSAWIDGLIDRRKRMNRLSRIWRKVAGAAAGSEREERRDAVLELLEARRERFRRARELLTDPERAAFAFVTTPERLPVLETERAVETLERYGIPVGAVLVNRVLAADGAGASGERLARQEEELRRIEEAFADHPRRRIPLLEADVRGPGELVELVEVLGADGSAGGAGEARRSPDDDRADDGNRGTEATR